MPKNFHSARNAKKTLAHGVTQGIGPFGKFNPHTARAKYQKQEAKKHEKE